MLRHYVIQGQVGEIKSNNLIYNMSYYFVDNKDEKNWNSIIEKFHQTCKECCKRGYYGHLTWDVELRVMEEEENGQLVIRHLVLKMTKELFYKYPSVYNFFYIPQFNENLSHNNKYQIMEYNKNKKQYELFYDKIDGFCKEFETEAEAWEYIQWLL